MYCSTLKKFRENLPDIEQQASGGWVYQLDLTEAAGVDVRTIRALRRRGDLLADRVRQNDVWISLDSIKSYCSRGEQ
jgi:hypothetical protein